MSTLKGQQMLGGSEKAKRGEIEVVWTCAEEG